MREDIVGDAREDRVCAVKCRIGTSVRDLWAPHDGPICPRQAVFSNAVALCNDLHPRSKDTHGLIPCRRGKWGNAGGHVGLEQR